MPDTKDNQPTKEVTFPYPKPRPLAIQVRSDGTEEGELSLLLRRPRVEECFCLEHGPSPESAYTRYLDKKDALVYSRLSTTRDVMAIRANSIIDHPCPDVDSKMDVLYAIDFAKRGHNTDCYKPLEAAVSCKVGTPIKPLRYSIEGGYRHPALLALTPTLRPLIESPRPLNFSFTPRSTFKYFPSHYRHRTEYEDNISRMGMVSTRSNRFYLEPQPSSRLRPGDLTTAH